MEAVREKGDQHFQGKNNHFLATSMLQIFVYKAKEIYRKKK